MTGGFHTAHLKMGQHSHDPMMMARVNHDPHNDRQGPPWSDDIGMVPTQPQ